MNPLPILRATITRHWAYFALFATIIAVAVALGVVLSAEERSFRLSSARAADKFDVLIAAPGSQTDVVMTAIYLRPGTVPLMSETVLAAAFHEKNNRFAAPIAFGDNHAGAPIVGTIAAFVDHLSGGLAEGRIFETEMEAVIGAASPLKLGETFKPEHGMEHHASARDADTDAEEHDIEIRVVGRMKPTGTPWDKAIALPVEQVWRTHSLPAGHAPGDVRIGPPFDDKYLSGVPAVVMRPDSIIAAYRLRGKFKTADSMSFFPAEVLVQLYGILGQVEALVSSLSLASYALVLLALMGGVFAILSLNRRQFAVLRVLGAPRGYIILCVWSYIASILIIGAVAGVILGAVGAWMAGRLITSATGIAALAGIGWPEIGTATIIAAIGLVVGIIPAVRIAGKGPLDGLN